MIGEVPNRHWSTIFKPYNWPFFAMDLERAFAARWWLVGLLLLIPSYGLFLVLTGRIVLAAAFSASLFVAPFFQWWYLPASLAATGLAMAALGCLIEANRRAGLARWLLLVLSGYCLIAFALIIYPPYQICIAIVIGLVGAGWLIGELIQSTSHRERFRPLLLLAVVGFAAFAVVTAYYVDVSPTIAAITNTVYPGQRRVAAGGAPLDQILGGPFDFWLTTSGSRVSQPPLASFFLTGIFVLPQLVLLARYRTDGRIMRFVWPSMVALGLLLAWAVLPLPPLLGMVTFLDRVRPDRVILGIGLGSTLLTFLALASPGSARTDIVLDRGLTTLLVIAAGLVTGLAGLLLRHTTPLLGLRLSQIAFVSAMFMVLVALVVTRRSVAAALVFVLAGGITSLSANPLYRGLGPLESSPLVHAAQLGNEASSDAPAGAVLSYLGNVEDPLLAGSGRPVVNAANLYPNSTGWRALDPRGVYVDAWNRYSGTVFLYSPTIPAKIRATAGDAVVVDVNPCDPGLDRLGVTTVISPAPLTDPCLIELGRTNVTGQIVAFTYGRRESG